MTHMLIRPITVDDWYLYANQIAVLEEATYEMGRRDSLEFLKGWVEQDGGLGLVVTTEDHQKILGYAFGGPLEHSHVDGPKQDKMRGKHNTFYSTNILLSSSLRGRRLGLKLKQAQIKYVRAFKNPDGRPRYTFMTGRNRVGYTPEIRRINRALGAYTIQIYNGQYGDLNGQALYYRIPLRRPYVS